MSELEDVIRKNSEFLNDEEPSDGHLERFENKLGRENRIKKKTTPTVFLKFAAIFILAIMSVLWLYERFNSKDQIVIINETKTLSDVSGDYSEVEIYYTSQIDRKYSEIEKTSFPGDKKQKQMLLNELTQMDSVYTSLQKELNAHPDDERVINAMISFYKTKLNILNRIIEQINEYKQTNNIENESTDI